jgi:hypothetical protein
MRSLTDPEGPKTYGSGTSIFIQTIFRGHQNMNIRIVLLASLIYRPELFPSLA